MAMIFGKFASQVFPDWLSPLWFALLSVIVAQRYQPAGRDVWKNDSESSHGCQGAGHSGHRHRGFYFWSESIRNDRFCLCWSGFPSDSRRNGIRPGKRDSEQATNTTTALDPAAATETPLVVRSLTLEFVLAGDGVCDVRLWWLERYCFCGQGSTATRKKPGSLAGDRHDLCVDDLPAGKFFAALWPGLGRNVVLGSDMQNPTSVLVERNLGQFGLTCFALLVCISCLGAINAMIFTSPRIYWATAMDYPALSWLAGSTESRRGWWRAMLLQAASHE